jgi:hypothetical protein
MHKLEEKEKWEDQNQGDWIKLIKQQGMTE